MAPTESGNTGRHFREWRLPMLRVNYVDFASTCSGIFNLNNTENRANYSNCYDAIFVGLYGVCEKNQ